MNYFEINTAILEGRDVDESKVEKNESFYKYLLNNRVAYYYSKVLSKRSTDIEKQIIKTGNAYNKKYLKTVKLLDGVCGENNIEYMIFKTHRYIEEPVDGDIDVLVKEQDFDRFLKVFDELGFDTEVDEPGKGKASKSGYTDIEPHINISWRTNKFVEGNELWAYKRTIHEGDIKTFSVAPIIDLVSAAGELYYSPEYMDLHRLKTVYVLKNPIEKINDNDLQNIAASYVNLSRHISKLYLGRNLPYFVNTFALISKVYKKVDTLQLIEIAIKNTYWLLRYRLVKKLPFTHYE